MKRLLASLCCSIVQLIIFSPLCLGESRQSVIIRNNNQFVQVSSDAPGTVYKICSKIDLKGQTVIIPEQCTLVFKRGELKNGTIIFQDTKLEGNVRIWCSFKGTVDNETIYTDWFQKGSKSEINLSDASQRIQAIFNLGCRKVVFGKGYYQFVGIQIGSDIEIEGRGTVVKPVGLDQDEYSFFFLKNVFYAKDARSVCIKDICFEGSVTHTFLPDFKSNRIYGEPLIWVDTAERVIVDGCVFKDIENCTYCNKAYNYYGKKQGSCVCLWDVSDASFINCEQTNCRHDEQVWIIAVNKPIMDVKVTYSGNYIHDMTPGPNSSAFTCVAGVCLLQNNRVDGYFYPGSMFNVFAKKVVIRNNLVTNSYCSSVFDTCEYCYFHNDEILVDNNQVEAVNSVLVLGQSESVSIRNNVFHGLGLYYSANNRIPEKNAGRYKYWYSDREDVLPTDVNTVIEGNVCDFTAYDGNRSIAGTSADYGTGEIREPQQYNNVGVNYGCGILIRPFDAKAGQINITNNRFTSIQSLGMGPDKNNLAGIFPHTIRMVNTENAIIRGNIFNGCYHIYQEPNEYACISIYNYPDVMEGLSTVSAFSHNPSEYGKYVIEDNVFNIQSEVDVFYPMAIFARVNSFRQTELIIDEIVVRNNHYYLVDTKSNSVGSLMGDVLYKRSGPVRILNEVVK